MFVRSYLLVALFKSSAKSVLVSISLSVLCYRCEEELKAMESRLLESSSHYELQIQTLLKQLEEMSSSSSPHRPDGQSQESRPAISPTPSASSSRSSSSSASKTQKIVGLCNAAAEEERAQGSGSTGDSMPMVKLPCHKDKGLNINSNAHVSITNPI